MPRFRGIVWDLDETLIVEEAAVAAAFTGAAEMGAARAGVPAAELGITARRCARARWRGSPVRDYCAQVGIASWEGLWARFQGDDGPTRLLRGWAPDYRVGAWLDALTVYGVTDAALAEAMAAAFMDARRGTYEAYADALEVLAVVRDALPMAVLTNGASCLQREKLEGAGLADRFDFVLVSGDIGVGKPDPRPFHVCAERLGVEPAALLMVGDSVERDVAGGLGAGFQALWLDRAGVGPGSRAEFDRGTGDGPGEHDASAGALRAESLRALDLAALREGRLALRSASGATSGATGAATGGATSGATGGAAAGSTAAASAHLEGPQDG